MPGNSLVICSQAEAIARIDSNTLPDPLSEDMRSDSLANTAIGPMPAFLTSWSSNPESSAAAEPQASCSEPLRQLDASASSFAKQEQYIDLTFDGRLSLPEGRRPQVEAEDLDAALQDLGLDLEGALEDFDLDLPEDSASFRSMPQDAKDPAVCKAETSSKRSGMPKHESQLAQGDGQNSHKDPR